MPPKFEITVRGARRSVQIEAIVDTGFSGSLTLPIDVAARIGAELLDWGVMELAQGSRVRVPVVICEVELLGVASVVRAFITDTFDPLIGTELLEHCQLFIDFDSGEVQLKRKSP